MSAPRKPRDVGNGLVCASFGRGGEWLSLAGVDPGAGFVELTGLPLFDPDLRGDADSVHRYRSWMRREEHAFLSVDAGRATIATREEAPRGTHGVVQRLVIEASARDRPAGIRIRVSGRLAPPTLAQVRDAGHQGPTVPDGAKSRVKAREGTLRVTGAGAPVIVQAWLRDGGEAAAGSAEARADSRMRWRVLRRRMPTAVAWLDWPAGAETVRIDIACTFDRAAPEDLDWLVSPSPSPSPGAGSTSIRSTARSSDGTREAPRPLLIPPRLVKPLRQMNQRAASYARTCTALQVGPAERCIIADHRILPLSLTRDAYWQARLLLATWSRGGHDDDARIVADHLRWLYLRCDRPDGRWQRSHLADGRPWENAFQADQQLYPLLELADFVTVIGGLPDLPPDLAWGHLVAEAWAATETAIDTDSGLLLSDEDPAGDVLEYPALLSNQVLLWTAASRLAGIAVRLGLAREPFLETATRARAAVDRHFAVGGPLGRQWAYAVNGRGGVERYVDATDLPLALAPLWGFCRPDTPAWRTTMRFAFDASNPGSVAGVTGGLGSRHTPGTWTLGDVMGWVAFGSMGDREASDAALSRLAAAAFSDGMLPEAYDPDGSGSVVRHWFAWPGAALGALVLEHAAR